MSGNFGRVCLRCGYYGCVCQTNAPPCPSCAALRGERNEALASIKRMQDYFGDVTITAKKLEEAEAALARYREAVEALIKAYEGEVKWFTADNAAKKRISDAWQGLYIASRTGEG